MHITIIGVGALGSHVVPLLRNTAQLRVIDDDRVEAKNTAAQFHTVTAVNQLKVRSLDQLMRFCWQKSLAAIPHRLVAANADNLLGSADLLIDCLDNGPSRRLVQAYARQTATPCLHGALAAGGGFGRVIWDAHFVIDEADAGVPTCEGGEHLPFIGLVAAYLAFSAQQFLLTGRRLGWSIAPTHVEAV